METNEPKQATPLKEWMDMLPIVEYYAVRKEIISRCKINDQIFRNWRNGLTAVYPLAKPIINEIAGYEIYNIEND